MKRHNYHLNGSSKLTAILVAGFAAFSPVGCGSADGASPTKTVATESAAASGEIVRPQAADLTEHEINSLAVMRQVMHVGHTIYARIASEQSMLVFSETAAQLSKNSDLLMRLYSVYRLDDPLLGVRPGQFRYAIYQTLHDDLVMASKDSPLAALSVGVEFEELFIFLVRQHRAYIADPTSRLLPDYREIQLASRNRLRTFLSGLRELGGTYQAKYLSQEEINLIIGSPDE